MSVRGSVSFSGSKRSCQALSEDEPPGHTQRLEFGHGLSDGGAGRLALAVSDADGAEAEPTLRRSRPETECAGGSSPST